MKHEISSCQDRARWLLLKRGLWRKYKQWIQYLVLPADTLFLSFLTGTFYYLKQVLSQLLDQ